MTKNKTMLLKRYKKETSQRLNAEMLQV